MERNTLGFIIWCIVGVFFLCLAAFIWFSKKAIGFWGSRNMYEVTDIRKYNHALSKLYCAYGIIFILLGSPLLAGHPEWMSFSSAGVVVDTIILIAVYSLVIEKKYKK